MLSNQRPGAAARARSRRTPDRAFAGFPRDSGRGDARREGERWLALRRPGGGAGRGFPAFAGPGLAGAAAAVPLASPRSRVLALARAGPSRPDRKSVV